MNRIFIGLGVVVSLFFVFIIFSDYCVACGCVVCKADDFTVNLDNSNTNVIRVVSASNFNDLLSKDVILIDIRTPQEFYSGHINGAVNLDFYSSSFKNDLDALDKEKTYFIYCRTGSRTEYASQIMKDLEFGEVYVLEGGITSWIKQDFPVVYS